jgi:hypothetical protein
MAKNAKKGKATTAAKKKKKVKTGKKKGASKKRVNDPLPGGRPFEH